LPDRIKQLQRWLQQSCALPGPVLTPASADASFRRYFRVEVDGRGSLIAMDAPPDKEDCRPFVRVAGLMRAAGIHVPEIFAQDLAQGFLLLEDLGSRAYLDALAPDTVERLYGDALQALLRMQAAVPAHDLPRYDHALLLREMRLFDDWLLGRHLGIELTERDRRMLQGVYDLLIRSALAQPVVCVHRDYHSRNLMVVEPNNPGVIDFQDAVAGPETYDLVSLLRDCYVSWPGERVDAWVATYRREAGVSASPDEFLERFDLMGVQRHLKAAGIFARLNHRDGKPGYLADIPRTLGYVVEVAQRRPALAGLAGLIEQRVLPALA
jgi:aminoglycoside/choline kinase family phosphotransferase